VIKVAPHVGNTLAQVNAFIVGEQLRHAPGVAIGYQDRKFLAAITLPVSVALA
jgi:hypothetical protein